MTSAPEGTMDALHELLAERTRYEGWLQQLEQRTATTPLHVLERVRADYTTRLEQVTTHLRGRAVELDATVTGLRARLAALASEEDARRDERAETELRASVGEFPPDRAQATIGKCDEAIGSLVAQREALGGELARLQDVLVLVIPQEPVASPAVDGPPPPLVVDASAVDSALDPIHVMPEPAPLIRPHDPTPPSAVEELEFLRSIVNAPEPAAATIEGHPDHLPPPVLAAPRRATPMSTGTIPGMRDPLRAVAGDGSLSPGNMPSFLKDMPTEQVKTLKCQECATMNYPTEWYCERCGGELAAM
ncbi:MAG: hypothetical protein ACT4P7_08670 [Gemmatimonadaceae bacterium]